MSKELIEAITAEPEPDILSEPIDEPSPVTINTVVTDDGVLDAHLRRQANVEAEMAEYMPMQGEAERKLIALNEAIGAIDAENYQKGRREARKKARADELATASERSMELIAEAQALRAQAKNKEDEARRLAALVKKG